MLKKRGARLVKGPFGDVEKIAPRQYAVGNDGAADTVIGRKSYKLEWNRGINRLRCESSGGLFFCREVILCSAD